MPGTDASLRNLSPREMQVASILHASGEDLPPPEQEEAFGALFDRYGDADVVLLGEASHGSHEFYQARAAISRHLIRYHGFNIVAVEADWPDGACIDGYVRHAIKSAVDCHQSFARFPSWMWRNQEVLGFVEWLRSHNEHRAPKERVEFRGLDIYSLSASIAAVLTYLDRVDPVAARAARERYGCLTPWQQDPAAYGQFTVAGGDTCEREARDQLTALLVRRLEYARRDGNAFFDAAQNARIVRAAERYYRIMYQGARESWNLRDRHMFDTLQRLMELRPKAKAIVWAHNSHVGNAAATSMGWEGEFNIGELCRTAYGRNMVSIGFGTDRGTVAAASDWDAPMEFKNVLPARKDSYEYLFRHAGRARSLTDWRSPARVVLREALAGPRLERAIGVVYRPDTELLSHYFRAVLSEQFDAWVWFETTRAVEPLGPKQSQGISETYPFGL